MTRAFSNSLATRRRQRTARRPQAETLEGRLLLSAGDLDTMFDGDGYVTLSTPGSLSLDNAQAVELQPNDGKILIAGDVLTDRSSSRQFQVVRLNADGTLDSSFGSGGRVLPRYGNVADMALQQDGLMLVAGSADVTTGSGKNKVTHKDVALVRLRPDGTLDDRFGQGGKVTTSISTSSGSFAYYDWTNAIAVQPDGKIVVGGETYGGSASDFDSFLVRYNPDGSLDTSFGRGGKVVTAWSNIQDTIHDLTIQDDGKIVVAGKGYRVKEGFAPYYVARYNADGTIDTSFGTDGTGAAITPFGENGTGRTRGGHPLALQPDGSIVFARRNYNGVDTDIAVARFTAAGVIDGTFGNGAGYVTVPLGGSQVAWSVAVQGDGKLVVAGGVWDTETDPPIVARFHPNGDLDTGFGNGGLVHRPSQGLFYDVAIQTDGKIVAAGNMNAGGIDDFLVARFDGGSAPLLATTAAPVPARQTLTPAQARPALARVLDYWRAGGVDTSHLGHINLVIADLGGVRLGQASGSTITLDDDAAGWGWSLGSPGSRGRGPRAGRMDLLSALVHEVGHLLGHAHAEGGVMDETLAPGERQADAESGLVAPESSRLSLRPFWGRGRRARAAARG